MPGKNSPRFHWKHLLFGIVFAVGVVLYWWSATQCRQTDLMFHLKFYGLPQSMDIVDPPSRTFEVRVRGPKAIVDKLRNTELTYPINLADAKEGVQSIKIDSERLPLPAEITVLEVSTGNTTLQLEKTIQKRLPITLHLAGKPAFGYTVTDKHVDPPTVMLKGPESKLAPLDAAPTHPIDISGTDEPLRKNIALNLPEGVTVLADNTQPLSATVGIGEERTEKRIDDIAVHGRKCGFKYVILPETIRLKVSGGVRSFADPDSVDTISVYLDLENLSPGIYVKPAVIHLPAGIRLVQAEPQVFTVQILKPTAPNLSGE